jgi:hypothetical protein
MKPILQNSTGFASLSLSESCTLAVIKIPGTFVCAKHECNRLMRRLSRRPDCAGYRKLLETRLFLLSTYLVVMVDGFVDQSSVSLNVIVFLDVMYILLNFSNLFFLFISCVGGTLLAILETLCFL